MSLSTADLLDRHQGYLPAHQPIPTFAELGPQGKITHMLVVTCADPRCIPENFLSLQTGEAVVIRNAGGNIQTALPSILAIDTLLDFHEIMVVKHTDCGSQMFTEAGVKGLLKERAPGKGEEIEEMDLGSISGKTLQQGLKEQVAAVRQNELLREELKGQIRGFVHNLVDGSLTEVEL